MNLTARDVDAILANTDWEGFYAQLDWLKRKPDCRPYDGENLCAYWESWISSGRSLHHSTSEGLARYMEELKNEEPRLKVKDITRILQANV